MPRNQAQYDAPLERLRSMGHALERAPGNIARHFHGRCARRGRGDDCLARDACLTNEGHNYEPVRGDALTGWGNPSSTSGAYRAAGTALPTPGWGDPVHESQPPSPEQISGGGSSFPANADIAVSSGTYSDAVSSTGSQA